MSDNLQRYGLVPFFTGQLANPDLSQSPLGRITAVQRARRSVVCDDGEHSVELSGELQRAALVDRPTVGDWVTLDAGKSRIEHVLERKSLFKRVAAGTTTDFQPIAANVDTLFIVTSCNEEFKESRLERYLTLCAEAGATPVIVLTKIDLTDDPSTYVDRARRVQAGIAVETVNTLDASTFGGVRAWIERQATVALVGSSGVGKSTLLNGLAGRTLAETKGIREQDKKGRHTTTHRALFALPGGGLLIDVPGMRELRVAVIEQSIGTVFEDIELLAMQCQFADCGHMSEPGCAVLEAVKEGQIDARRLSSYHKLQRENDLTTASVAEKRARGRQFAKLVKEAKSVKKGRTDH